MIAPVGLGVAALVLSLFPLPARAGACADDIYETDQAVNARLSAIAAHGKTGVETTFATTHHQPTPGTIAQAEAKVGDVSEDQVKVVTEDMIRARNADAANDLAACEKALTEARKALGL
jgi:hypothetical protein